MLFALMGTIDAMAAGLSLIAIAVALIGFGGARGVRLSILAGGCRGGVGARRHGDPWLDVSRGG